MLIRVFVLSVLLATTSSFTHASSPTTYMQVGKNATSLKKKVLSSGNSLTQELITTKNTIYVIQNDYKLVGNITIPEGCSFEFDGGSIRGAYTITGINTIILAGEEEIFSPDIIITGTWNVMEVYPEWFGAKGDGLFDDAIAINKCFSFSSDKEGRPIKVVLTKPKYYVGDIINFSGKSQVCIEGTSKNVIKKIKGNRNNMFDGGYCKHIQISNLTFDGSLEDWSIEIPDKPNWSKKTFNACIIGASNTSDLTLDNCVIRNFYYGVYLGGANERKRAIDGQKDTDHITITNCIFERNKMSCIDTYNRYGLYISNNFFKDNGNIAIHIEPAIYNDLTSPFDTSDISTAQYPSDGVNICNNTFVWNNTPGAGIKLYRGVYAANVTSNHFINSSAAIHSDGTKIFTISNNTIKNGNGISLYGKMGSGTIYGNELINVTSGISCYNDAQTMGCVDIHDNLIVLRDNITSVPDAFKVQNSKYHDNIIKGFFNNSTWKKRGILDITGASNCEIYNNKLLKCNDSTIPFFVVPITNQEELSSFIKKGVRIYDNVYEQKLDYEFSTDVAKTRPVNPYIGQKFYDLNLNKLIIFVGKNWVDSNGNIVN